MVIALFFFGIILLFESCSIDHSIVGTRDYDTVTIYRFDKGGKGELILPNSKFTFTYKIKDDTLTIVFESENATYSIYTFSVTDKKLTLTAESSDAVHVLTKKTTDFSRFDYSSGDGCNNTLTGSAIYSRKRKKTN